ncbi:hypothetical protein [Rubritalea tangerina]
MDADTVVPRVCRARIGGNRSSAWMTDGAKKKMPKGAINWGSVRLHEEEV